MSYIGANGIPGVGATNYGSGLGDLPSSALAGISQMGMNGVDGGPGWAGLGSFGNMPTNYGLGQSSSPAPAAPVKAASGWSNGKMAVAGVVAAGLVYCCFLKK